MTRNGKIARLPKEIREELNKRLQNGEMAEPLATWLNSLPEVKEVVKTLFDGRAINEGNISEWKIGGYVEWEEHQEAKLFVQQLKENAEDIGEEGLFECFSAILAAQMVRLARVLMEREEDVEKRWERLKEVNKELSRLRRDHAREVRVNLQQKEWERAEEERDLATQEAELARMRKEFAAPVELQPQVEALAPLYGKGAAGKKAAAFVLEMKHGLPVGRLDSSKGDRWEWGMEGWEKKEKSGKSGKHQASKLQAPEKHQAPREAGVESGGKE